MVIKNNEIPASTPSGGKRFNLTIAAMAIIAFAALVGYYFYAGAHPSRVVNRPTINQTQNSTVTTTAQATTTTAQRPVPMKVTGANGVFNNSNTIQQKPPTPPATVGG